MGDRLIVYLHPEISPQTIRDVHTRRAVEKLPLVCGVRAFPHIICTPQLGSRNCHEVQGWLRSPSDRKGDGALSLLNAATEALNLAKEISTNHLFTFI